MSIRALLLAGVTLISALGSAMALAGTDISPRVRDGRELDEATPTKHAPKARVHRMRRVSV